MELVDKLIGPIKRKFAEEDEKNLRNSIPLLLIQMKDEEAVVKSLPGLWHKNQVPTIDETKDLIFEATAVSFIPENIPDSERLRLVFSKGSSALQRGQSLESLAGELNISRGKVIDLYQNAAYLVFRNHQDKHLKKP